MHARVGGDARVAALCKAAPNPDVGWLIKVHAPPVNPDDGKGLGRIHGRDKHCAAINDVIFRPNEDKLLGKLCSLLVFGTKRAALPKQNNCPCQSRPRSYRDKDDSF
jgi:hypothetical protein